MDVLRKYMVRVGSLELGIVIFWMLFWLANGLAKVIPGVHIGVKFAEKGDTNPFTVTLDKMGWGTSLGEFAWYFTAAFELLVGVIFLWALVQFFMRTGPSARQPWILLGLFISAIIFTVFAFSNVVTATRPDALFWHTAYFASVGVSWLVVVSQGMWARSSGSDDS